MTFMLRFKFKPDLKARDAGIARFRRTGGKPPKGATIVGRWTCADFSGGFALMESKDTRALAQFALDWSDLMDVSISPVLTDVDLLQTLKRVGK